MPYNKPGDEMRKFKEGDLHSGSASGPKVTNRKQAIAIELSEQRSHGFAKGKNKKKGGFRHE